jgi:hypothetical protein
VLDHRWKHVFSFCLDADGVNRLVKRVMLDSLRRMVDTAVEAAKPTSEDSSSV